MDKEEILARSRKENKDMDFVEAEVLAKANGIGLNVGVIVCGLLSVLHVIFLDDMDYSVWIVYFSTLAAVMIFKYVKLRRRHELVMGLLYGAGLALFCILYLKNVLGVDVY